MHFEFATLLRQALLQEPQQGIDSQKWSAIVEKLQIEVVDGPKILGVDVASSVCFELVADLARNGFDLQPMILAELVKERVGEIAGDFCDVFVGGGGHLNCVFKDKFLIQFFNQLVKDKANSIFARTTLVFNFATTGISQVLPAIDWDVVCARARRSEDFDLKQLFEVESDLSQWRLMLLALLSDKELSSKAFLNDVQTSENVPWFFRHFFEDTRRYEMMLSGVNCSQGEFSIKDFSSAQRILLDHILCFRRICFSALITKRPEFIILHLRKMIFAFYRIYNHPQNRDLLRLYSSPAELSILKLQTQIVASLVDAALVRLDCFLG